LAGPKLKQVKSLSLRESKQNLDLRASRTAYCIRTFELVTLRFTHNDDFNECFRCNTKVSNTLVEHSTGVQTGKLLLQEPQNIAGIAAAQVVPQVGQHTPSYAEKVRPNFSNSRARLKAL
jgi:hypothetical protein